MIRLKLMKEFFYSVDAEGRSAIASGIAGQWSVPGADVRVVNARSTRRR
jgi:hypothetical protein